MRQYLDLLQDILDNGFDHEDRTGHGRRSIYGPQIRFNMADGFPLVTTRKANFSIAVKEMLWFLRGEHNIEDLGCGIWDQWAARQEDVAVFNNELIANIDQSGFSADDKEVLQLYKEQLENRHKENKTVGSIGRLYGLAMRNIHRGYGHWLLPNLHPAKEHWAISPSKMEHYLSQYEWRMGLLSTSEDDKECIESMTLDEFIKIEDMANIDQMENLVYGLKTKPFSARHVVSLWVQDWLAFEGLSPQQNVVAGRGALAPCHVMIQCFVSPPDWRVSPKHRLSLMMYQRSVDTAIGAVTNIAEYSLLLHMLAQVTNMRPHEFIWNTGDCHLYLSHIEGVKEQVKREPLPLPMLKLNPDVKDLFAFTEKDIELIGYESHPPIKYETY